MKNQQVSMQTWLERLGDARSTLELPNAAYSDHPFAPVPLEQRRLDSHLIWFTVDHGFSGTVDGQPVALQPGTLSWFAPGTAHSFVIPQGLRTYRLRIRLLWQKRALRFAEPVLLAHNAWELRPVFESLLLEITNPQAFHEQRLRYLCGLLACTTFRSKEMEARELILTQAQQLSLQQFLTEHLQERISPADLAQHLDYSPDYFSRIFKRSYGMTARSWIIHERLRLASNLLLESTLSISEIALHCGFCDLNLFSRQFRQVFNCAPRQFRKQAQP